MDGEQAQSIVAGFKRGQIASALWNVYAGYPYLGVLPQAPKSFARRIARFIELGVPFNPEERPGKAGIDFEFTVIHAIELGIALDLQNAGLNQLEIVRWLILYREPVRKDIANLIRDLNDDPKSMKATYLMVRNRKLMESRSQFEGFSPTLSLGITIGEPIFVSGQDEALEELSRLGGRDRIRIVVELSDLVRAFIGALPRAPVRRRGRQ